METRKLNYPSYKQMHSAGKVTLGIEHHAALRYVKWLPFWQRAAIHFWSWVAILLVPAGLILGYMYSWWWLLLVVTYRVVWNANKQSVAQFLLEYAEENPWLYEIVSGDDNWVYKFSDESIHGRDFEKDMADVARGHSDEASKVHVGNTEVLKSPANNPVGNMAGHNIGYQGILTPEEADHLDIPKHSTVIGSSPLGHTEELRQVSGRSGMHGEKDILTQALGRYARSFQQQIPKQAFQDMQMGLVTKEEMLARVEAALQSGKPDPEWAAYKPPDGSMEERLVYRVTHQQKQSETLIDKGLAKPDDPIYSTGLTISPMNLPKASSQSAAAGAKSEQPFGVPLDRLEVALKAGHMTTERDGNTLIGRQDGITTRISVDQPEDRKTEEGAIQAVVTIRTELPSGLSPSIAKPQLVDNLNRMTTIGALMTEGGRLVIGSRITVHEGEDAWDLQAVLIVSAALSSAQSMLGAIQWALTKERRADDSNFESSWSDQDLEEVRGYLSHISVCTAGKGGLTAEFSLRSDSISAIQGDQYTALWRLITDQPHPQAGGGLFCLLEMPHQANDPAHLGLIVERLNVMEMAPLDLPPHIGAWCTGTLGNNPAYATFLPNFLHDKAGIAVNVSVWAAGRAQWANAMLASLGVKIAAAKPVEALVLNESLVREVLTALRSCAMVMLENAIYIQKELSNVLMDDSLRAQTVEVCSALVGAKHDAISELFELDELLATKPSKSVIISRVNRLEQWLWDDIKKMHSIVTALNSASTQDPKRGSAYLLVAESATNILNSFNRFTAAADALRAEKR